MCKHRSGMKWISYVLRYSNRNKGGRKKWCMKKWAGRRTQERWGSKDQDIALKLRELSVDTAGGWWGENHVREYHAVTNHPAISQLRLICQPSVTQPLLTLSFFLPSHNATETFLCVDSCCRHKQVTMAPVWDHEVSAVTGRGRRGLVAQ